MSATGKRIRVTGRVQGVGYRYYCLRQASTLSICGGAKNETDGSVEVVAVGEPSALDAYIAALRQGPRHSAVESVEFTDLAETLIERILTRGGFEIN